MACIRTTLLNFNDLDNQEARVTSNIHTKLISRKSFIAGYLIFGNLADNAYDPKLLLVLCMTVVGGYFILASVALYACPLDTVERESVLHGANDSAQFFYAGINIIITI